jgi:hypothetical protein
LLHSLQRETERSPPSGSVVPSWSQRSIRCAPLCHSTSTVTIPSFVGWGRDGYRPGGSGRQLQGPAVLATGERAPAALSLSRGKATRSWSLSWTSYDVVTERAGVLEGPG